MAEKRKRSSSSSEQSGLPPPKKAGVGSCQVQDEAVQSDADNCPGSSASDVNSGSSSRHHEKGQKEEKKKKRKHKESRRADKRKKKKKKKHHHRKKDKEAVGPQLSVTKDAPSVSKKEKSSTTTSEVTPARQVRTPMTKEEWEKQQSVIRRVHDPTTGRDRLVKGDGEILEEIVSKDRHKQINKQATLGDGLYYQSSAHFFS